MKGNNSKKKGEKHEWKIPLHSIVCMCVIICNISHYIFSENIKQKALSCSSNCMHKLIFYNH